MSRRLSPFSRAHKRPFDSAFRPGLRRGKSRCSVLLGLAWLLLLIGASPFPILALPEFSNFGFSSGAAARPWTSLTLGPDGRLYGTANEGGADNLGALFRLSEDGKRYAVLHSFDGHQGRSPRAALRFGPGGMLYGTTSLGGIHDQGIVFRIRPDGSDFQVLHEFGTSEGDGGGPGGALAVSPEGLLYGTTIGGGIDNQGTIFRMSADGSAYQVLRRFQSSSDEGKNPQADLLFATDGRLYGTTYWGGIDNMGTVFSSSADGIDFVTLRSFGSSPDGEKHSFSGLVEDASGRLIGMTTWEPSDGPDPGVIYRIQKDGSGYEVLLRLGSELGGRSESTPTLGPDGTIFATLAWGGNGGYGTAIQVVPQPNGSYQARVLADTLVTPYGGLVRDSAGILYGTTYGGRSPKELGTVFRLHPPSSNPDTYTLEFLLGAPRDYLVQQVDVDTYLPPAFEGPVVPVIRHLPDGTTLYIRDGRLLRLTTNAQPDLTFGNGTGQVSLPFSDADSERVEVKLLSNGGLQLLNPVDNPVVVRLTATGLPDLSFGGGAGTITLPGQLMDTSPDGDLLSQSKDGRSLQRFRPDGSPVPGFSSAWKPAEGIYWGEIAKDGRVWAMAIPAKDNLLFVLGSDGLPDASFPPRAGLHFATHGFDQAGRGYFPVADAVAFGDPSQGIVARFLADGTYDSSYRSPKHLSGADARLTDTRPDGTTLVIIGGRELIEIDPSGNSRRVYENQSGRKLVKARLIRGDEYILNFEECFATGTFYGGPILWQCRESQQPFFLASDGSLWGREVQGRILNVGVNDLWFWNAQERFENLKATLNRIPIDPLSSEAGWTRSGMYSRTLGIRVPLQRSGAVDLAAVVRGRVLPGTGRPWSDADAFPFEVRFPVGKADAILELPDLVADPQHPLREYLVRLEASEGVALGSFAECRLRVLEDSLLPVEGEFKLTPFPVPDEQQGALLLYQPLSGKVNYVGLQMGLQGRWGGWPASENHVPLGPIWLTPVPASSEFPIFFKSWYP